MTLLNKNGLFTHKNVIMQATVIIKPDKFSQFTTVFRSNFQLNVHHRGFWDKQNAQLRKIAIAYSLSY